MAIQTVNTIGKHKIPRFIYHMTSKKNWESMLNDKTIKTSPDFLLGKGIFAIELTNFFKYWKKSNTWLGHSLQERLIQQASKNDDDIVILRIPTIKLDLNKLFVRSQNRLFDWAGSDEAIDVFEKMPEMGNETYPNGWLNKIRQYLIDEITKQKSKTQAMHLATGDSAKMSSLYEQRKEAIEYVYMDNIPISYVEKIGEAHLEKIKPIGEGVSPHPIKDIFISLLKGTPEAKAAELLTC